MVGHVAHMSRVGACISSQHKSSGADSANQHSSQKGALLFPSEDNNEDKRQTSKQPYLQWKSRGVIAILISNHPRPHLPPKEVML